ncbi:MAG: response regulator transcription factor [Bacteroidales bacterium]|nr:response regulator transcription factor [Bacteroidales bacterium]
MNEIKNRLLLAEDDENLGSLLQEYLKAKGYETDWVMNGERAFRHFEQFHYDLCILDVMMPIKDGFTLASEMRIINSSIPIIFLTAKSMKEDILEGFSLGADDYITKPFSMEELLFRIEAILRRTKRTPGSEKQLWKIGKFTFDSQKQLLIEGSKEQKLTTKESELLRLLCNNMNQVLERNFALKAIWIDDNYFNARSMDVYITKLRKYLKSDSNIQIINVHGKGYKLIADEAQP